MSPNEAEASSLMRQAQERLADLRKLPLSEKSASFRLESAYEAIREAMQAFSLSTASRATPMKRSSRIPWAMLISAKARQPKRTATANSGTISITEPGK